jgi:hypothetical protein
MLYIDFRRGRCEVPVEGEQHGQEAIQISTEQPLKKTWGGRNKTGYLGSVDFEWVEVMYHRGKGVWEVRDTRASCWDSLFFGYSL